ncbi:MAG TPA: hypothetical protein PLO65_10855 [Caulobacter sp.]|nr:hypothetical protein [Caulobacter sp.]
MAKATSVRVPEFIPAEPDLLSPAVKQVLRVLLAVGSTIMLVGFVVATFVAVF